jgi:hypothetical protein
MAVDELAQIKTALAELNEREAPTRRGTLRADHRPSPAQSELAELQSLLSADSNLREFGESLTRRRDERRKALQAQMRSDAQTSQAVGAASSAAAIAARRHALALLAQPFTSSYVTLDEPFLIWELPHPELDIFRDSNIETFGSWVKILVDTKSTPGGWHATDFRFYFLWENPSDYYAVANVSSSLALNGQAVAWGAPACFRATTLTSTSTRTCRSSDGVAGATIPTRVRATTRRRTRFTTTSRTTNRRANPSSASMRTAEAGSAMPNRSQRPSTRRCRTA